jgi:hypothetical protein
LGLMAWGGTVSGLVDELNFFLMAIDMNR